MKETIKLLTFQEVKVRLEKVQKALEALQVKDKVLKLEDKKYKTQLISLKESLENKLNILTEMDKGVIHTDDENKAKELAEKGWFLSGNRVLLSRRLTDNLLNHSIQPNSWGVFTVLRHYLFRDINRVMPFFSMRVHIYNPSMCFSV